MTTPERRMLQAHLRAERDHVLATVEGLGEADLTRTVAPSGWSMARLLNHLTHDVEIFWGCAVVGGDEEARGLLQDGWAVPVTSGAETVERYRAWSGRTDRVLATTDLDAPPRWWPPADLFPFPPFGTARQCVFRLLVETATHAGHLDMAREGIDGRQHLVVG